MRQVFGLCVFDCECVRPGLGMYLIFGLCTKWGEKSEWGDRGLHLKIFERRGMKNGGGGGGSESTALIRADISWMEFY